MDDDQQNKREAEDRHDQELAEYLRRIGARSLAAEMDDLRFRTRIIESQRWLDKHDALISEHALHREKYDQRLLANQAWVYDKAQAYNNFVVTLGYAGMFGIWSFVRDVMDPWDMKLIAVLLGASLVLFMLWTVAQSIWVMRAAVNLALVIYKPHDTMEDHLEAIARKEAVNMRNSARQARIWPWFFVPTVLLGFGAAFCLLAIMLADIIGRPFALHQIPTLISNFFR